MSTSSSRHKLHYALKQKKTHIHKKHQIHKTKNITEKQRALHYEQYI